MAPRMAAELPKGEGTDYTIYPEPLSEPYKTRRFKVGELLYKAIGVAREDKPARYRQYARNYRFFDAPVALFFAREKAHGPAQWADIGGYLQTVCLLARGYGLHTCPQQAWVSFHRTIRSFLKLPDNLMIYSGMAIRLRDQAAPINAWRSPREPLDAFATFEGFESEQAKLPSRSGLAFTGTPLNLPHAGTPQTILRPPDRPFGLIGASRRHAAACLPDQDRTARGGRHPQGDFARPGHKSPA